MEEFKHVLDIWKNHKFLLWKQNFNWHITENSSSDWKTKVICNNEKKTKKQWGLNSWFLILFVAVRQKTVKKDVCRLNVTLP